MVTLEEVVSMELWGWKPQWSWLFVSRWCRSRAGVRTSSEKKMGVWGQERVLGARLEAQVCVFVLMLRGQGGSRG